MKQIFEGPKQIVSIEIPQKFSPWEIVRHDVVFPVRFFGQVQVNPDGS